MSRVARDAGTVAVVTAVARAVGFVRWLVFAWAVGATGVGTVYQSVNTVPNIVYEIAAGGVLAAVVVPLVAARVGAGDAESADDVASALLTRTLVVLLPLALLVAGAVVAGADDEVGSLSRAFNRMTNQLAAQRSELLEAYRQIDDRRRFTAPIEPGNGGARR